MPFKTILGLTSYILEGQVLLSIMLLRSMKLVWSYRCTHNTSHTRYCCVLSIKISYKVKQDELWFNGYSLTEWLVWSFKWLRFLHGHHCNQEEVCYHKPPKHKNTHRYILLYTYVFIDKNIPEIVVYNMSYTCNLHTVDLRVLQYP